MRTFVLNDVVQMTCIVLDCHQVIRVRFPNYDILNIK